MAHETIHLLGICGTGMGTFAGLLKASGHDVRGSDTNIYPPMSDKLADWGIEIREGYRAEHLEGPRPDLVVIGNVIRRENPEAVAVMESGIPFTSFPEALGERFLKDRHSVVVSGTHGKTTTTSLCAWLLYAAGRDPGFLVGGVPKNFGEGFRVGAGDHFVVEGDEYDTAYFDKVPKFLHYHPRSLIITSLEFDHADIYANVEAIEAEFDKLLRLVPTDGKIFACAGASRVLARLHNAQAPVETYARAPGDGVDWSLKSMHSSAAGSRFEVLYGGTSFGIFESPLAGAHNAENALAAIAFGHSVGLTAKEMAEGLKTFSGIDRRQTLRAEVSGIRIVDDFAHHPTAVRETTQAVRQQYGEGRLLAVFEPRSATSSRAYFQDAYAQAFRAVDLAIIAPVGRKEITEGERLDVQRLARQITEEGTQAVAADSTENIIDRLKSEATAGDTILIMSNGGFDGIYDRLEAALKT